MVSVVTVSAKSSFTYCAKASLSVSAYCPLKVCPVLLSGFGVLEMLKQALHVNKRIVQSTSADAFLKNKRCLFIKGDSSIKFK